MQHHEHILGAINKVNIIISMNIFDLGSYLHNVNYFVLSVMCYVFSIKNIKHDGIYTQQQ